MISPVKLTVFTFVIQAGASQGSQSDAEDLRPYGALSVPVQRKLEVGTLKGYGALAAGATEAEGDGVLVVPDGLNLAPYGALSDRVQLRLSQGYAGYSAPPPSSSSLTEDAVLVEAANTANTAN